MLQNNSPSTPAHALSSLTANDAPLCFGRCTAQDNVALIVVLDSLEAPDLDQPGKRQLVCVANTHIHANPELKDVKLWQVRVL
jgi:hypothetical protein